MNTRTPDGLPGHAPTPDATSPPTSPLARPVKPAESRRRSESRDPAGSPGRSILRTSLVVAASVPFLIVACGEGADGDDGHAEGSEHRSPADERPPVAVEIATVEAAELEGTEEVVGTVRAKLRATLEAKVSGQIASLGVSVGDRVTKGDLLAELSVSEVRAQLVEARAVLEQAEQDLRRTRRLFEDDAASQRDLDATEARFRVARAKVREARSVLDYARIEAPFDGVVTHKLADVGDLATPGRPLLEVEDPSALRLEVAVPEALSRFVGLGATLDVEVDALDAPTTGTVAEIAPSVDPNSRTLLVKLDLPQAERLRAGQFGRALVPTGRAEVLRVPEDAVVRRGQLEMAFVVHEGRAVMRLVKTAKRTGDQLEVVSGLEPGEVIVVDGARDLVDGQRVALPTEVSS